MHPAVKAVGFTGSTAGGRSLFDIGAARPEPIPVYAEMGSLNPVLLAPSALHQSSVQRLAAQLSGSVTGGWGQFCTKPGVLLVPTEHIGMFAKALTAVLADVEPGHLLTEAIRDAYLSRLAATTKVAGVQLWRGSTADEGWAAPAVLAVTDTQTFVSEPALQEEHFGPFVLLVGVRDLAEVDSVLQTIGGTLTGTVHGDPDDPWTAAALRALAPRAGRVLVGGVPTGVAVAPAQMHGGPYPSSTAAAHTSVGTAAIRRFLRPVAYQEVPDALLPPALRDDNPWGTRRLVDGQWTTAVPSLPEPARHGARTAAVSDRGEA
jgi:NADP-dependent aldehyde dehydrogenase